MSNENQEIVVDFESTVDFIFAKLIEKGSVVSKETIVEILELETDYLKELGIIY